MDLVFEIGCEELPAGSLKPALEWMAAEMNRALDDARLNGEGEGQRANIAEYATPRRLALVVTAIAERSPDVRKTVQGPPAKAAFQDGKPTKAAEGFARKIGVPVSALRLDGDRVVVEQQIRGQSAAEALPGILERIIRGIPFKKSMRWDSLDKDAFARPVHWISAVLDGKPLPVSFADVKGGATTRGHRFAAPKEFAIPSAKKYVSELRSAHVLVDWAERKQRIWEEVQRAASGEGGEPLPDDDLLETVTGLVEEPFAVAGQFDRSFLELPPEVLISEMRGHQKYFSVRDPKTQRLLPVFVAVSNTRVKEPAVSRRGYERVLRARLSDGKFFFDEDRKVKLGDRIERLARRTFMDKLGSELERVERIREISLWLHGASGKGEPALLRRAAELCKADLTTGMVGEFPELQGVMGRVYAQHDGEPAEVAEAIFEHYLPRGAEEKLPRTDTGALLGTADRLDLLVGVFGIGKEPSGTADPYGLRRAALGLLRVALARRYRFEMRDALAEAQRQHVAQRERGANNRVSQDPALIEKIWGFLAGRLETLWRERAAPDSIQAVLHTRNSDVVALEERLAALTQVREKNRAQFEATAATFKRIGNILAQAREKKIQPMGFDRKALRVDEPAEAALADALERSRTKVTEALEAENYLAAYAVLAELRPAVDAFFDKVLVMHQDDRVRDNRLALLRSLHELFSPLADFGKLQVERA
ncbi:MAG TPA: glycine--tRNA ligase subunit beta [Myxococcales bacterium]|jgi:glycyl-tRNA synthetase beta chain|nr:glycine--tRNA ligase subunit beta [Myxococcales bacterium]